MVHSIRIYNIMEKGRKAVTQRFSHQASNAMGSLIAEFTCSLECMKRILDS